MYTWTVIHLQRHVLRAQKMLQGCRHVRNVERLVSCELPDCCVLQASDQYLLEGLKRLCEAALAEVRQSQCASPFYPQQPRSHDCWAADAIAHVHPSLSGQLCWPVVPHCLVACGHLQFLR